MIWRLLLLLLLLQTTSAAADAAAHALPLPVLTLDLRDGRTTSNADAFSDALRTVGAAFVRVRGLPADLAPRAFASARELFADTSDTDKRALNVKSGGFTRGFVPLGGESGSSRTEVKEAFSLGYDWDASSTRLPYNALEGHNVWPSALSAASRTALQNVFDAAASISRALVRHVLTALPGLEDLTALCDGGETISLLRVFKYFGANVQDALACHADGRCTGSSPHTDWGLFTLILLEHASARDALQFHVNESWVAATPEADDAESAGLLFLVNVGDYLALLSKLQLHSPLHRVLLAEQERISFVFFGFPRFDAVLPKDAAAVAAQRADISLVKDQSGRGGGNAHALDEQFGELMLRKWAQVFRESESAGGPDAAHVVLALVLGGALLLVVLRKGRT